MTITQPVVHVTIAPTPSPATVAALRARIAARADRIARWNADIDIVVITALAADDAGHGIAIAADYCAGTITAELDEDIPAGYALVSGPGQLPRLVHLSTINLARSV
ncbi:hypothetical protein [Curtobacterium oceanosedimentum]|uniref:hypothetical protein n=1 Tax=Curtobacterium oceanosedimentum TaxID=465820 RepID=UPI0033947910